MSITHVEHEAPSSPNKGAKKSPVEPSTMNKLNGGETAPTPDEGSDTHFSDPLRASTITGTRRDGSRELHTASPQPLSPASATTNHASSKTALEAPNLGPPIKSLSAPAPVPPTSESPQYSPATPSGPMPYPQPEPSMQPSQPSTPSPPRKLLSTHLLHHPDHSVSEAMRTVFPHHNPVLRFFRRFKVKHSVIDGLTQAEMAKWEKEGKTLREKAGWKLQGEAGDGVVVSELFWKMYLSLMPTLERDPLSGLVPPDLLGSTTTMPLSIISLIPDIMRHYRDVIIRARKEIFLATNYWQPSNSVNTISQSLKDLSALIVKEGREKVVVKIMYDRGSWEQLWNSHAPVKPEGWTPLDLPSEESIPGLDLEVINFHRVLLGTFHAKFLVVDRKVALLNSNNIQDRPNLELMSHFEGPVVDAFYEIALHSWYNRLSPPLPCMSTSYQPPRDAVGRIRYLFQDRNPYFDDIEILKAARAARLLLKRQTKDAADEKALFEEEHGRDRFREAVQKVVDKQRQTLADWAEWKPGEEISARTQNAMHELREFKERLALNMGVSASRAGSRSNSRAPSRRASASDGLRVVDMDKTTREITAQNAATHAPDPSEAPSTPTVIGDTPVKSKTYPQPKPLEDGSAQEKKRPHVLFLDTNDIDGTGRLFDKEGETEETTLSAPRFGGSQAQYTASPIDSTFRALRDNSPIASPRNDRGDVLPVTAQMPAEMERSQLPAREGPPTAAPSIMESVISEAPPEGTGSKRMFQLSKKFNDAGVLSEAWATVEDSDEMDNFQPHIVHKPHEPFPVAMCCRKPHGLPGHHDIRNPQNAAWLAGFRYAQKKIIIQTPTLNARPIVRAVKQACRRGVEVHLLLDLGFNDRGESIPFQGGTNEEVVDRLYKVLGKEKKNQHLKVYWYTGKDQVRPLNAVKKQRNCHVKAAFFDGQVSIIGNGNQDSQSWFHSQEVNAMMDNKQVTEELIERLLMNQNTMTRGAVGPDGVWRDETGKGLVDYGLTESGAFRGLKAFVAFAKTI